MKRLIYIVSFLHLRFSLHIFMALFLAASIFAAAPVAPIKVELKQPDGTIFMAMPQGSAYANWMETLDGYTIVEKAGTWYYAEMGEDGELQPSSHAVGDRTPEDLAATPKHLRPPVDISKFEDYGPIREFESIGGHLFMTNQPTLTILVDFTDITCMYTDASFQSLMFGASGSVKAYYQESSYSNFSVNAATESYGTANDGIVHVAMAYVNPNFGSTFGAARDQLFRDAVTAADPYINYASYDANGDGNISAKELAIVIIAAGYENSYGGSSSLTPRIWGHMATIASGATLDGKTLRTFCMFGERHATSLANQHQATIGIMCHENGHLMLGLPDLYDRDGSSEGIGNWGVMGSGNWNTSGGYSGNSPAHFTGWDKARVGWIIPGVISSSTSGILTNPADTTASLWRIWVDKYKFGESFLLESRRLSGFDTGLPGPGLLITHLDDKVITQNDIESHKLVDIEEADGLAELDSKVNRGNAGDPYPGSTSNTTFNDSSNPNSKDYNAAATGVAVTSIASVGGG